MLSGAELKAEIDAGHIRIEGLEIDCLRPSSYLLRLAPTLLVSRPGGGVVDTRQTDMAAHFDTRTVGPEGFDLQPGHLYLGNSVEKVGLAPDMAGTLFLLSSLARAGIAANFSASLISATFGISVPGTLTFEITNVAPWPIRIYAGVKFCHLCIFRHGLPADLEYRGIYGAALGPMPANFSRRPSR